MIGVMGMVRESFGRRLLSALAGSTPAFMPTARSGYRRSTSRHLLSALAGSTPAFTSQTQPDAFISRRSGGTASTTSQPSPSGANDDPAYAPISGGSTELMHTPTAELNSALQSLVRAAQDIVTNIAGGEATVARSRDLAILEVAFDRYWRLARQHYEHDGPSDQDVLRERSSIAAQPQVRSEAPPHLSRHELTEWQERLLQMDVEPTEGMAVSEYRRRRDQLLQLLQEAQRLSERRKQ
jgi:hypothetical protein